MKEEFDIMFQLRGVSVQIGQGMGTAGALVRTLSSGGPEGKEIARKTLLGLPPRTSLSELREGRMKEVAMLSSLIAWAGSASSRTVGKRGEELSALLETWLKGRVNRNMQDQVYRFRGLLVSAVLGGVLAMVSTLAPLVSSLNVTTLASVPHGPPLFLLGAGMVGVSSLALGAFMGGRYYIYNTLLSLAVFGVTGTLVSPLTSVSSWPVGR